VLPAPRIIAARRIVAGVFPAARMEATSDRERRCRLKDGSPPPALQVDQAREPGTPGGPRHVSGGFPVLLLEFPLPGHHGVDEVVCRRAPFASLRDRRGVQGVGREEIHAGVVRPGALSQAVQGTAGGPNPVSFCEQAGDEAGPDIPGGPRDEYRPFSVIRCSLLYNICIAEHHR